MSGDFAVAEEFVVVRLLLSCGRRLISRPSRLEKLIEQRSPCCLSFRCNKEADCEGKCVYLENVNLKMGAAFVSPYFCDEQ